MNENFASTYLKVGAFQIINGQKVGGNVASYFCLFDGSVVHAIPGPVAADKLLMEAQWAYETRKAALTLSSNLVTGKVDAQKYLESVQNAHAERYQREGNGLWRKNQAMPANMPRRASQSAQVHWLLATQPLAKLETVYPVVWTQFLGERLSALPVEKWGFISRGRDSEDN